MSVTIHTFFQTLFFLLRKLFKGNLVCFKFRILFRFNNLKGNVKAQTYTCNSSKKTNVTRTRLENRNDYKSNICRYYSNNNNNLSSKNGFSNTERVSSQIIPNNNPRFLQSEKKPELPSAKNKDHSSYKNSSNNKGDENQMKRQNALIQLKLNQIKFNKENYSKIQNKVCKMKEEISSYEKEMITALFQNEEIFKSILSLTLPLHTVFP